MGKRDGSMVVDPPPSAEGCCAREACGQSVPNEAKTKAIEAQQTPRARILFFEAIIVLPRGARKRNSTASHNRISLVCD
jgi:hypothetical protein